MRVLTLLLTALSCSWIFAGNHTLRSAHGEVFSYSRPDCFPIKRIPENTTSLKGWSIERGASHYYYELNQVQFLMVTELNERGIDRGVIQEDSIVCEADGVAAIDDFEFPPGCQHYSPAIVGRPIRALHLRYLGNGLEIPRFGFSLLRNTANIVGIEGRRFDRAQNPGVAAANYLYVERENGVAKWVRFVQVEFVNENRRAPESLESLSRQWVAPVLGGNMTRGESVPSDSSHFITVGTDIHYLNIRPVRVVPLTERERD